MNKCTKTYYSSSASVVRLVTGPQPLSRRVLHRVQSSASCCNFHYPLISLRSYCSCLHLLPRLPVTSVLSSFCLAVMCFVRQFYVTVPISSLLRDWPSAGSQATMPSVQIGLSHVSGDRGQTVEWRWWGNTQRNLKKTSFSVLAVIRTVWCFAYRIVWFIVVSAAIRWVH
jgi:hypothetical protein